MAPGSLQRRHVSRPSATCTRKSRSRQRQQASKASRRSSGTGARPPAPHSHTQTPRSRLFPSLWPVSQRASTRNRRCIRWGSRLRSRGSLAARRNATWGRAARACARHTHTHTHTKAMAQQRRDSEQAKHALLLLRLELASSCGEVSASCSKRRRLVCHLAEPFALGPERSEIVLHDVLHLAQPASGPAACAAGAVFAAAHQHSARRSLLAQLGRLARRHCRPRSFHVALSLALAGLRCRPVCHELAEAAVANAVAHGRFAGRSRSRRWPASAAHRLTERVCAWGKQGGRLG